MFSRTCFLALFFLNLALQAQHLSFSKGDWSIAHEGEEIHFVITATDSVPALRFYLEGDAVQGMTLDSAGNFSWRPDFELVSRQERIKYYTVVIAVLLQDQRLMRQEATFSLTHTNREPIAEELPVFYVRQGVRNQYQISGDYVFDPDGDQLVFKSIPNQMSEGMVLSPTGLLTWTPSKNQFNILKNNPVVVELIVQDLPDKSEKKAKIKIAQTQLDLSPEIILVPGDSVYSIKEDELVNLKIYANDPNGDDNITAIGFVASDNRLPKNLLKENAPLQSEFTWSPGYSFVDEAEKGRQVDIIFYAIDKASNKTQRRIKIRVQDAENLDEKDKFIYQKYRISLISAKGLLDQLDEKHSELTKLYKQAKRGKKHRAIVNASLGAATGLSPVVLPTDQSKVVSGIGGTTVLTLGTLEATEVIGKSKTDILDQMRVCVEIRNQLQIEGDNFARRYALKSERRKKEFDADREKLLPIINNQKLLLLELDAARRKNRFDNKDLKKAFPDFSEEL